MHITGTQQANLPKPIIEPHSQCRVTPHDLHIQRCSAKTWLILLIQYLKPLEMQPMHMPRCGQLVEQIADFAAGRQPPSHIVQVPLGVAQRLRSMHTSRYLGGLGLVLVIKGLLVCLRCVLQLPPFRPTHQAACRNDQAPRSYRQGTPEQARARHERLPVQTGAQFHDQEADIRACSKNFSPAGKLSIRFSSRSSNTPERPRSRINCAITALDAASPTTCNRSPSTFSSTT